MKKYTIVKAFGAYAKDSVVQFSEKEADRFKGLITPYEEKKPETKENKKADFSSKK
jgi:hypothetical protein